jgi:hypothetical protein
VQKNLSNIIKRQTNSYNCAPVAVRNLFRQMGVKAPKLKTVTRSLGTTQRSGTWDDKYLPYFRKKGFKAFKLNHPSFQKIKELESKGYYLLVTVFLNEEFRHLVTLYQSTEKGLVLTNSTVKICKYYQLKTLSWMHQDTVEKKVISVYAIKG